MIHQRLINVQAKRIIIYLSAITSWFLITFSLYSISVSTYYNKIQTNISNQLKRDLAKSDFEIAIRGIKDLELANTIRCSELKFEDKRLIFQSNSNECSKTLFLEKSIQLNIHAFSGNKYHFSTFLSTPQIYTNMHIIIYFFGLVLFIVFYKNYYLKKEHIEIKLKAEKERNDLIEEVQLKVAHDIRSPLTALNIVASTIKKSNAEQFQLLEESIKRINYIADHILDDFKKDNHKLRHPTTTTEIINCISSITDEKKIVCSQKNISIDIIMINRLNEFSYICNINELNGVLSNIINNSIEAINGQGQISIKANQENKTLKIHICDTGCGISISDQENIFKKGFSKGKNNGSGLGLYQAKKVIESFDGKLSITSSSKGTIVTLELKRFDR